MAKDKFSRPKTYYLINPHNFPVTVDYGKDKIILSPKQKVKVGDISRVGNSTARIIKVTE